MKNRNSKKLKLVFQAAIFVFAALSVLTGCPNAAGANPGPGSNTAAPQNVLVTIEKGTNVTSVSPESLTVVKGTKWSDIKEKFKVTFNDGYEPGAWQFKSNGTELKDTDAFNADTTIFVSAKEKGNVKYAVRHLQQNTADDNYTCFETEIKFGTPGQDTKAKAKTYSGFTAQGVTQSPIAENGSTVVDIKYDRKRITLTFNLDGGTTSTALEAGNTLVGKYGSPIIIAAPTKPDKYFDKWEPVLPETFPAADTAYTAKWLNPFTLTVGGDDRLIVTGENSFKINPKAKWEQIKSEAASKVSLQPQWQTDYEVYEWHLTDANGELLNSNNTFTQNTTVYAVTNYNKFKREGSKLTGYTGDRPQGKIIIPDGITEIGKEAFKNCDKLRYVHFDKSIIKIGQYAFFGTGLLQLILPANINTIENHAFYECSISAVQIPKSLTNLGVAAFGACIKLTDLTVQSGNAVYESDNNLIYKKGKKELVCAAAGNTSVTVPDSVTLIGSNAFNRCEKLTTVTLSSKLTTIEGGAFYGCQELTQLKFPATLKSIEPWSFHDCNKLDKAEFTDPNNWYIHHNPYSTNGTQITGLDNPQTAAQYLKNDHKFKFWKKK